MKNIMKKCQEYFFIKNKMKKIMKNNRNRVAFKK